MGNLNNIPQNLKYTKDHEWALIEGDIVTLGITDFAQSSLGDIVFLEIPEIGKKLSAGGTFGVVESIKSVSDLYSPASGEVIERNTDLEESPEKINEDPYSSWMIKIKVESLDFTKELLESSQYEEFCQTSH